MSDLEATAQRVLAKLIAADLMVATAESCTGGMIVAALTDIAGSSATVDRGFVTYSNDAKTKMLGVPSALIADAGAVSEEVALAMVKGALNHSQADIAVSVTGIAGPSGGSAEKPVGTVHFACQRRGRAATHSHRIFVAEDRVGVRKLSAIHALELVEAQI